MKKLSVRLSCLLLSIAMLFSLLPVSAFAADAPEEGDVSTLAAAPEDEGVETPEDAPEDEEEPPQTDPALTIEGYTRVTDMPAEGLATGKYLIVACYDGKYYMVYPGTTAATATAKNSARLVVGVDGKATGYQVGYGTAYDEAEVSTDFSVAENAIYPTGNTRTVGGAKLKTYHIKAVGPDDAKYFLEYTAIGYNTSGDDASAPAIQPSETDGCFYIRAGTGSNQYFFFFSTNMNFNHAGSIGNAAYFPDLMLFKSDTPYTPEPEVPEQEPPVIPGYTQLTGVADLDESKGYMIVSQDAEGNLYALYPSADGEIIGAGNLIQVDVEEPDTANVGARTATLTVDEGSVSATWLKDGSTVSTNDLLFTINECDGGYWFTAFNGRHLNMASTMFTEGLATLTLANRGGITGNAFQIKNGSRNLDFTKTGDPHAFYKASGHTVDTWGTDFWSPTGTYSLPVYLFESTVTAPTARERLQSLVDEIGEISNDDGRYVPLSWTIFDPALTAAKDALDNAELTNGNAAEFFNAWATLETAYKMLLSVNPPEDATKLDVEDMIPASGTTQGEPFPAGTAACDNFRIPAMITLQHQSDKAKNGRLVAAIDARWDHAGDACALDTIASYSDDNGASWTYNFPNYFGDSTDAKASYATAFIDPVIVEGSDGTIYLMVDLWPGGVALNTAPMKPAAATGYVEIDGEQRLVLYTSPVTGSQNANNYAYYVDDFDGDYAPVQERTTSGGGDTYTFSGFYVDKYYYLYSTTGTFEEKDPDSDKTWCQRLGSTDIFVQQNVFFYDSLLHARNVSYLWIVKSTDGGETWSEPVMINDQVRTGADQFYGVGPGAGLCVETSGEDGAIPNGTIILPVYTWSTERAGFIYSTDKGETWHRGNNATTNHSSESCLVQIDDTTVRHFYRDANITEFVRYTDHTWNGSGWDTSEPVITTAEKDKTGTQLSAIKYSKQIDGKDAIILSTPGYGTRRTNGRIHVLLINEDQTMELAYTYSVNDGGAYYCYSSLTETTDGSIALLYESAAATATLKIIPIADIVPTLRVPVVPSNTTTTPPTTTETKENEDGTTTTIVTDNETGTVTETTEKPDGTVEIVKTKEDGTVTETTKNTDGSTEVVETKPDGTVTATATDPEGGKVEKVTTPEKDVTITATDAEGEVLVKVEIPAEIPALEDRFADVPEGHWADEAIHDMAALEIVNGVGNNNFNLNGDMKRGDLAVILSRMSHGGDGYEMSFTDVPDTEYYASSVAWAAKTGVVTGRSEEIFAPEDTITREELAVMLYRYAKLLKLDTGAAEDALDSFKDGGDTHSWAEEGVAWCVDKGILRGKGNGVLDPRANVTRAQVAVMLQRLMDLLK